MNNFNVNKFFYYDELSQEAQAQARINILVPEVAARQEKIAHWKMFISMAKTNQMRKQAGSQLKPDAVTIHTLINNRLHHKRFVNGSQAYYKIKQNKNDYLVNYIRSNLATFTDKGDYVYYIKNCVEVVSGGNVYFIDSTDQKQLAIQAYIDVNERGPKFHRHLYNTWHRIKHFMIVNSK